MGHAGAAAPAAAGDSTRRRSRGAPAREVPARERHGPSTGATVVLDIGGHSGALVVYTAAALAGREIEIRPDGEMWAGRHTAVRARHMGDVVLHAGVFDTLPAGRYDLRIRPDGHAGDGHTDVVPAGGGHAHVVAAGDGHAHDVQAAGAVRGVLVEPGTVTEVTFARPGARG